MKADLQNSITVSKNDEKKYNCDRCLDTEVIYVKETNTAKICECVKTKQIFKDIEKQGMKQRLEKVDLYNTEPKNQDQKKAIEKCIKYFEDYKEHNLILTGQSGTGKTHFTLAVMKELLLRRLIRCKYVSYRDLIFKLNQSRFETQEFNKIMKDHREAEVLIIDDMFKASLKDNKKINNSELQFMFEIINYRYNNKLPTIVSTELKLKEIHAIDEALASRLFENTKSLNETYVYEFEKVKNIRYGG